MFCDLNLYFPHLISSVEDHLQGIREERTNYFQRLVSLNTGICSRPASLTGKKNGTWKVSAFMTGGHTSQKKKPQKTKNKDMQLSSCKHGLAAAAPISLSALPPSSASKTYKNGIFFYTLN